MSDSLMNAAPPAEGATPPADGANPPAEGVTPPVDGANQGDDVLAGHTVNENIGESPKEGDDGFEGYIGGKYKTGQDLEDAYKSLRKEFGDRPPASELPDKYEIQLPEDDVFSGVDVPDDDPMVESFREVAKGMGLSQDQFNTLVAMKIKGDLDSMPNPEEEMKLLGPGGPELIAGLNSFYKSKLSPESYQLLHDSSSSAAMVKLFDEIRNISTSTRVPKNPGVPETIVSQAEADNLLAEAIAAEKAYAPDAKEKRAKATAAFKKRYPK